MTLDMTDVDAVHATIKSLLLQADEILHGSCISLAVFQGEGEGDLFEEMSAWLLEFMSLVGLFRLIVFGIEDTHEIPPEVKQTIVRMTQCLGEMKAKHTELTEKAMELLNEGIPGPWSSTP